MGESANYSGKLSRYNTQGEAEGRLVGGNLALIAHLIGSESSFNTKNKILFLEDIGEYIYNVDRMMLQLKRSGMLEKLAGLVIGCFTDMKDTTVPFGQSVYEVIHSHVKDYPYPVCFQFPVSHEKENYALKIGVKHKLTVTKQSVQLTEIV